MGGKVEEEDFHELLTETFKDVDTEDFDFVVNTDTCAYTKCKLMSIQHIHEHIHAYMSLHMRINLHTRHHTCTYTCTHASTCPHIIYTRYIATLSGRMMLSAQTFHSSVVHLLCITYISGHTLPHACNSFISPQDKSALAGILDVLVSDELIAPYDSIELEELASDMDADDSGRIPLNEYLDVLTRRQHVILLSYAHTYTQ